MINSADITGYRQKEPESIVFYSGKQKGNFTVAIKNELND